MQRMKVVLPEPDGPMMQTVSPFVISSETPFSTSSRPKLLCTFSACMTTPLIGASESEPGSGWVPRGLHPLAEAQLLPALTLRQATLDPRLDERPCCCEHEVPEGHHEEV